MDNEANATAAVATEVAAETMLGDLMKLCIDEVKAAPDVWQKLSEAEQQNIIDRVRERVRNAVEESVRIIATQGYARIRGTLESVTIKDGIKAVLTLPQFDPARHELVDAQGTRVYIVVADVEAFSGGGSDVKPEPDQGALVLDKIDKIGKAAKSKGDGSEPA